MVATPYDLVLRPEQERAVIIYAERAHSLLLNQFSLRSNLENIDRNYMRENNFTEAQWKSRFANRAGDITKMQDPTVPIIMPQVETALAYFANVFLTGYPIFGVAADPLNEDTALQFETIIGENSVTAGWARQMMMFFRDGLKYNLHALECDWQQRTVWTVETDVTRPNNAKPKTTLWNGNVLKRMDLYNTFFDPRVHPTELHENGEYAGYIEIMSRIRMKKFINDLYNKVAINTVMRALESAPPATGQFAVSMSPFAYYLPLINPDAILNRQNMQTFDWMAWAQNVMPGDRQAIKYNNVYEITKLYARILPADFGFDVPEKNTPQVWKFIIVNGSVVLVAERMTNVHNWIPIFFGQPLEDGLDFQTKSFATNVQDMQQIASAMVSGYMASQRRNVGDRVAYDPSRIRKEDISSTNPVAKIAVRPSAFGKPVSEAFSQFPFHNENTQSLLAGANQMMVWSDLINGQNPAQRGQFVKGNKTKDEFNDIMGAGEERNQMMAIMTEAQVFTPLKECLKLNILQFQTDGTLYNTDKQQPVTVKSADLRKTAVQFKVSDGLVPTAKELSTEEMIAAFQAIESTPALQQGYNVVPMFTYLNKLRGADLSPFEKSPLQQQFDQMTQQWQQVALQALKEGKQAPPQPQMPPELVKELQQKAQSGGVMSSPATAALASTQGNSDSTQQPQPAGQTGSQQVGQQ